MKKNANIKLRLDAETIRMLRDDELRGAAGGMSAWWKCSGSCRVNCETTSCDDPCITLTCG